MTEWRDHVDLLKGADSLIERTAHPNDPLLRAKLSQQFAMNLSQGYFLLFQSTPDHPEFAPFETSVFLAQPNPDAGSYYAPVDGPGVRPRPFDGRPEPGRDRLEPGLRKPVRRNWFYGCYFGNGFVS